MACAAARVDATPSFYGGKPHADQSDDSSIPDKTTWLHPHADSNLEFAFKSSIREVK
ncbi:UNVERIFIED_CONTAM: hypothetical protein Sangu_0843200 [Sesamum angustifolium]|uniref:Uncharacterized protein n=1 Tax=Sesamum angustifolium TaxID=2727405 RepID=A0AAW2PWP6_9LAMI